MPERNIDWIFFRENIEGAYILGSKGIQVNEDLAVDFVVETKQGSERIARAAFEYAKNNGKKNVTVVTKANIVKLTDGNFIKACKRVAEEYPEIDVQERFVDATAAKLDNSEFNEGLQVFVLPNLYGDIITDIAAEIQGGLGTAGSANLGKRYAVFEAIHGTAPFLMNNGRGDYADPCSLIRAVGLLLSHIGYTEKSVVLDKALEICTVTERKVVVTTLKADASAEEFTDYLMETLKG
jgi:isocitrate dehydrogenase (NAD+)